MDLRSLARVVVATSGRAILVRAVPLLAAVGIGAAIVFGGSGMHPRDLVLMLASSAPFRLAAWAAWIAMATPAAAAAFDAPGTVTLRALRPPRAIFAMLALLLAALQVPWISLYAIGAGPLDALVAALLGVAGTAAASSIRSRRGLAFLVATVVVIGLAPPATLPIAAIAWVLPIACAMAAWSRRASRARRPSTFVIGAIVIGVAFTLVPASC